MLQRERAEDVGAGANAAVQHYRDTPPDGLDDRRERIHRRDRAVDLAPAVVGDDDPVHPVLDGRDGVCGVQDPLEEDRQSCSVPQECEVVPGQRRA